MRGQCETANGFTVNGHPADEGTKMGTAIVGNFDSSQEVCVLTNLAPQHGNDSGVAIIAVTKSNRFHGKGFQLLYNTKRAISFRPAAGNPAVTRWEDW